MTESIEPKITAEKPEHDQSSDRLDRIVSEELTEEEKREVMIYFRKLFDEQDIQELKGYEIGFSKNELALVNSANSFLNEELHKYGIKRGEIPSANIHKVTPEQLKAIGERHEASFEVADAVASPYDQAIFLINRPRSRYNFLATVIHEIGHLKSFLSMKNVKIRGPISHELGVKEVKTDQEVEGEDSLITARRLGWNMEETGPRSRDYFHHIDEALTEDTTARIMREKGVEIFGQDFGASEKLRLAMLDNVRRMLKNGSLSLEDRVLLESDAYWLENDVLFFGGASDFLDNYKPGKEYVLTDALSYYQENDDKVEEFNYRAFRRRFWELLRKLYERNRGSFHSEEDIRALFIKGQFDGNIMPVARLVEKTFGKGSFRRLGDGEDITS